jgi:Fe2+ or Zn2+ uptake regulation protein
VSASGPSAAHPPAGDLARRLEAARAGGAEAAALLREAGCRPTAPRLLILQALAEADHPSADEVLAGARARHPAITPSTVYRALDALVEAGIARQSDLGVGRRRYEMAREHRHHHAVCERCGAVAHLHDSGLGQLAAALADETGYRLSEGRELAIPGVCPACQAAERRG